MTWKQIETSREVRLWISQIVIPAIGVTMMVPEAREAVVEKFQNDIYLYIWITWRNYTA